MKSNIKYFITLLSCIGVLYSCNSKIDSKKESSYIIPKEYLKENPQIPNFWVNTPEDIEKYIKENVKKGKVTQIGKSAGGRKVYAISYGIAREDIGTTTFSGSLGVSQIKHYRGKDSDKIVYMGIAGVHGFELEGIVGIINFLSVLETGKDLKGKSWPEANNLLNKVDRIVLIPLVNPDGRARVPVNMEINQGADEDSYIIHEYLNTGGTKEGKIIGWPDVKEYIPMDFQNVGFPGGYPNDNGYNIMHDDFFGNIQPETKILFDISKSEKPDLIINMHTGVPKNNYFMTIHRPFCEPWLQNIFDSLYFDIKSRLTVENLQGSKDLKIEANPKNEKIKEYNLSTALNLHTGALSIVIESPSHGFSGTNLQGHIVTHTPEMLVDAQIIAHLESLNFLIKNRGRGKWEEKLILSNK